MSLKTKFTQKNIILSLIILVVVIIASQYLWFKLQTREIIVGSLYSCDRCFDGYVYNEETDTCVEGSRCGCELSGLFLEIEECECFASERRIMQMVKQLNYCTVDEDCVSSHTIPVCDYSYELVNANTDLSGIREQLRIYAQNCKNKMNCNDIKIPEHLACINSKCKEFNYIFREPNRLHLSINKVIFFANNQHSEEAYITINNGFNKTIRVLANFSLMCYVRDAEEKLNHKFIGVPNIKPSNTSLTYLEDDYIVLRPNETMYYTWDLRVFDENGNLNYPPDEIRNHYCDIQLPFDDLSEPSHYKNFPEYTVSFRIF